MVIAFLAFIISFSAVPFLILLANSSGAIAVPGKRHVHSKPTPKLGGIAIASTVLVVSPFVFSIDNITGSYLLSSAVMLILGIFDDLRGANWKVKLGFSIVAISVFMAGSGVWITDLGDLFGLGSIHLGYWGIPFTVMAVFGVINAVNLADGLDGLACGIASIAFISFAVFASISGNSTVLYLCLVNLGATLGLFKYNYPKASIFMGDSGSQFLGFSLAVIAIMLTQTNGMIKPMVPVVILVIPIFDALRVLVLRIINKRHPFLGDKTHLHHLIIRSGVSRSRAVMTMWILSALMSCLAFVLFRYDSWLMLLVLCIVIASIGVFIENLRIVKLSAARK